MEMYEQAGRDGKIFGDEVWTSLQHWIFYYVHRPMIMSSAAIRAGGPEFPVVDLQCDSETTHQGTSTTTTTKTIC